MARIPAEGSGTGPSDTHATILITANGDAVQLPEGLAAGSLELARDGQDLVMTAPDGQVYIVEGYFLMPDAPVITGADGSQLTPSLVQSFLKTPGDVQIAANDQATDESPVGEVTEVSGASTVTHADGTKEKIAVGTQIFEGDIIETDEKGAVNIHFADDSTFAISQNARLAVDDFSFNADDQSGSTGLSILRGVFMFTSGLIGRENPDAVTLETPVGSIGIRGTIIGGEITEGGRSQISVIEGAIVVRNGSGEQILSDQFETVQLTGFNAPITNVGTLNSGQMSQSYGAVRAVSPTLFTSIDDAAGDAAQPQQAQPKPGETKSDAQPQQPAAQDGQPQSEAQPSGATETPVVFQTLETGSHLNTPTTVASQPAAPTVTAPVAPASAPATSAPATQPTQLAPQLPTETPAPTTSTPVDNRAPASLAFILGGSVNEESAAGTIVGTLAQTESLPFAVTYALASNPGNMFSVNATTGVVTLIGRAGDYDTGTTHHDLVVRTTRTGTGQYTDTSLTVNLTPVDEAPKFNLGASGISVNEGDFVTVTAAMVGATDPEGSAVTYTVANIQKGAILVNGSVEMTFTHTQLLANQVQFIHNGEEPGGAGFTLTASDGALSGTAQNFTINVSPVNDAPVLVNANDGAISEGGSTLLTEAMLKYTDSDNAPAQLVYTVGSKANGEIQTFNGAWYIASTFTQQDIIDGKVRFVHNGSETQTAEFTYTLSDGTVTKPSDKIEFSVTGVNDAPYQIDHPSTPLPITENAQYVITNAVLDFGDDDNTQAQIVYNVTNLNAGIIEKFNGTDWVASSTFTQADIGNNLVRFSQNGSENTAASFTYSVSDGASTPTVNTFNFAVTPTNDAPTSIIATDNNFSERAGTGSSLADLTTIAINDGENPANNPNYSFTVERYDTTTSTWIADPADRFTVYNVSGVWKLGARENAGFDHETEPTIKLRVILTDNDGTTSHTIESNEFTITITDINEPATNVTLNDDMAFALGADALLSGKTQGAYVGILHNNDPDTTPGYLPNASDYQITNVTGSLNINHFEIVDVADDKGHTETVIKLKDSMVPQGLNFATPGSGTISVWFDANGDNIQNAGDINRTFAIATRDDMMILEAVNGKNGFRIDNDALPAGSGAHGAHFGSSIAVADINNDGFADLIFGAPYAKNGSGEEAGGVYTFHSGTALTNDAANGEVLLSNLKNASLPGSVLEMTSGDNDNFGNFGSEIVNLKHFNSANGPEFAITNPGKGGVEIVSNGMVTTVITNIPNNGIVANSSAGAGQTLANGVHIAAAGDLNGDGYADLLVSSTFYDGASGTITDSGRVGVIFGSASHAVTGTPNQIDFTTLTTAYNPVTAVNAHFGASITGLGDINGDGFADFMASAPDVDTNSAAAGANQGSVYVYFGATNAAASMGYMKITGVTDQERLGSKLASAGDFNGDGLNDMLIRSETADGAGTQGTVHLLMGSQNMVGNSTVHAINETGNADFVQSTIKWSATDSAITVGKTLGSAGDFNGDGYDDIFVDVSKNLGTGQYEHTLFVLYGSATPNTVYNLDALLGTSTDANTAYKIRLLETASDTLTVTKAGDYNGDGYDDLLIGDPGSSNAEGSSNLDGAVYMVYGNDFNGKTTEITNATAVNASTSGQSFVGNATNNSVNSGVTEHISFIGGAGNDTFIVSNNQAIRNYDGGTGGDTIRLFYSQDETAGGTADLINLTGLGKNVNGVERIEFDATSLQDTLKLDIKDILSMMMSSDTHSLTISALAAGGNNGLSLTSNGVATNLMAAGFTADYNINGQADTTNLHGTGDAYVYTHIQTGFELIVDSRLTNAATLATA